MNETYDWLLKTIIIGDAGVGKSCILSRFIDGIFDENSTHTM
jgi:GTPase SAR1 family protein